MQAHSLSGMDEMSIDDDGCQFFPDSFEGTEDGHLSDSDLSALFIFEHIMYPTIKLTNTAASTTTSMAKDSPETEFSTSARMDGNQQFDTATVNIQGSCAFHPEVLLHKRQKANLFGKRKKKEVRAE